MSPRAEALTKEMETFAVAARSPREGPGIADIGATDELTGSENEMGSLGDGRAADSSHRMRRQIWSGKQFRAFPSQ